MRRLILMRHGKAATASGQGDHARPLSPRGRGEAAEAGRRIAALAPPDFALVSDSLRTRQTFEAAAFAPALPHRVTRELYGAPAAGLLAAVRATAREVETLLVVGHNPGTGDLARTLARDGAAGDLASLAGGFPTSCFAVIAFDVEDWAEVGPAGRLVYLFPAADRSGP